MSTRAASFAALAALSLSLAPFPGSSVDPAHAATDPATKCALKKQQAAAKKLTAKVKNAVPPMLEGDIFSSLFEGATSWKVGACQADAKTAHCPVALSYVPPPNAKANKPANWNDTVLLVNTPQGWKVDDVIYDAGFAFGNTGRLSAMLQMVITANP